MISIVQLQNDVYHALLAAPKLLSVNVKQFRKLAIASEIDKSLVCMTTRNGKIGAGVLVEMPTLTVDKPNVEGPIYEVDISLLCMEQPTINLNSTSGTCMSAEELAQNCLDIFHLLVIDGVGQLRAAPIAIQPATEFPGMVAYRAHMSVMNPRGQTARAGYCTIVFATGQATITCSTGDEVWFTTDGSYPCPTGNPVARKYSGSFDVNSGDVIRASSWAADKNLSAVRQAVAP